MSVDPSSWPSGNDRSIFSISFNCRSLCAQCPYMSPESNREQQRLLRLWVLDQVLIQTIHINGYWHNCTALESVTSLTRIMSWKNLIFWKETKAVKGKRFFSFSTLMGLCCQHNKRFQIVKVDSLLFYVCSRFIYLAQQRWDSAAF